MARVLTRILGTPRVRRHITFMSRTFTSHRPKPARVTRTGAAPGQSALTAPPAPIPRPAPTGKAPGKPTGKPKEIGGPSGPEPTRYGDWERNGICVDF
jgi:hypothetical protein